MSIFQQLFARRVPQILGLYVAGTWMAIEIGDWLIDKFSLPEAITAYIFVGLAVLLPAVAVVAWFHGAPGKDRWTPVEKTIVPLNLIAAAAALFVLNPKPSDEAPLALVQTRTVVDETGASQSFEVPVEGFHKNITLFFVHNETGDEDHDWLSYAIPLLVEHDLNHETPLVSATSPFGSDALKESLRERGFELIVGAPRSLQLTIARERRSDALLSGTLELVDGALRARLRLVDVTSGSPLAELDESLADLLPAADRISLVIQRQLEIDPKSDTENDPLRDNLTADADAVRNYVDARIAVELRNDYAGGIALLTAATERDGRFAQAFADLANLYYLNGNIQQAQETVGNALAHDYKLSVASRFLTKARRYIYQSDFERAIKVLSMWTEVEPLNPQGFRILGTVLMLIGQDHDRALANLQQALAINPTSHRLYSSMATVEQGRGNYVAAAEHVQTFLEVRPEDTQARLQLAMIYIAANDYDNARKAYQDAELVSADNFSAALGMATLEMRTGDFDEVAARVDQALERTLTPQQRVQALNTLAELQYLRGELQAMLQTLDDMDQVAEQFLPPLIRVVQIGVNVVNSRMLLGDFEGAHEALAQMGAQVGPPLDGFLHMPKIGIEWEQGDEQAALASLEKAERFADAMADPTYAPMIAFARVYRHVVNDDAEQAVRQATKALELMDSSILVSAGTTVMSLELRVDLARMMRRVGAQDEARAILVDTLRRAPRLASAHLEMAYLALNIEDVAQARRSLDEALEVWRDGDERYLRRREAKQLLASLGE